MAAEVRNQENEGAPKNKLSKAVSFQMCWRSEYRLCSTGEASTRGVIKWDNPHILLFSGNLKNLQETSRAHFHKAQWAVQWE